MYHEASIHSMGHYSCIYGSDIPLFSFGKGSGVMPTIMFSLLLKNQGRVKDHLENLLRSLVHGLGLPGPLMGNYYSILTRRRNSPHALTQGIFLDWKELKKHFLRIWMRWSPLFLREILLLGGIYSPLHGQSLDPFRTIMESSTTTYYDEVKMVEIYCSHRVAMQFGYDHGVPRVVPLVQDFKSCCRQYTYKKWRGLHPSLRQVFFPSLNWVEVCSMGWNTY